MMELINWWGAAVARWSRYTATWTSLRAAGGIYSKKSRRTRVHRNSETRCTLLKEVILTHQGYAIIRMSRYVKRSTPF